MGSEHISVLLSEAVEALQVKAGAWYVDATFGRGGHTAAILSKGGKVIAFDVDQAAITYGQEKFTQEIAQGALILVRENFAKLAESVRRIAKSETSTEETQEKKIAGVLFDFGVSSPQLDQDERGFSFQHDGELDMRMDDRLGVKAKDLLAILPEKQLAQLFWEYGGEDMSRAIARQIVKVRAAGPIASVQDLVKAVERVKHRTGHLHPATKVFQALRIAVNDELSAISQALPQALEVLAEGGRVVTISFHEGEDRIVKKMFRHWDEQEKGKHLTTDVVTPSELEVTKNTRARSAKMRIYEKTIL